MRRTRALKTAIALALAAGLAFAVVAAAGTDEATAVPLERGPAEAAAAVTAFLEVDGLAFALSEVGDLTTGYEVIELTQNTPDGRQIVVGIPGPSFVDPIGLRVPGTHDFLIEWLESQATGGGVALPAEIVFYDRDDVVVLRAAVEQAWPQELTVELDDRTGLVTELLLSARTLTFSTD